MYHKHNNPIELVEQIYEEAPVTKNVTLGYFVEKIKAMTGELPSKSTVKRWLNEAGISVEPGRRGGWAYRHNAGKGE